MAKLRMARRLFALALIARSRSTTRRGRSSLNGL